MPFLQEKIGKYSFLIKKNLFNERMRASIMVQNLFWSLELPIPLTPFPPLHYFSLK